VESLSASPGRTRLRFGVFEVDPNAGELWKHGLHIKLHDKPFQVLQALLEHPGEIVTRKELQERLWPGDTFVEFENGLNNAISRLRETLGDSADSPHFVETVPRHGYRFIASVETGLPSASTLPQPPSASLPHSRSGMRWLIVVSLALTALMAAAGYRWFGASAPPLNSVAVLPLVAINVAEGSEDEYLAFGMTEALTAELSKISALKVISQTSAMQYKGARKSLPQIARELGVAAVVEGSVVREGNEIRVTVQLIDAATDTHLWAETYQRELRNTLAMQTEIAAAIAREVHVALSPGEQATLSAVRTVNPAAHEAYLRGRYFYRKQTEEGIRKALPNFEQAVAIDPSYAPAHAGLSDVYWEMATGLEPDPNGRREARRQSRAALEKALELDETLTEAHVSRGYFLLHLDWDWAGAERAFRRAIALSPNSALAHSGLAEHSWAMNRPEEALRYLQRACELDPVTVLSNRGLGSAYFFLGQNDLAIARFQKALELESDAVTMVSLGLAYLQKDLHAEALAQLEEAVRVANADWALAALAYAQAITGKRDEAQKIIRGVAARGQAPAYTVAMAYAGLGENDKAFEWLERSLRERESGLILAHVWPQLAPLRSHPRFHDLMRRMNLPSK